MFNSSCSPDYQNKGLIKFIADKLFENAKSKNLNSYTDI